MLGPNRVTAKLHLLLICQMYDLAKEIITLPFECVTKVKLYKIMMFLVREQSKEYCENTSLHGFQYLVKTGICARDKNYKNNIY